MVGKVTRKSVSGADRRLKLIARFGVGYDMIDVPALTDSGVLLTITPDGVRRPVASSALTFLLMLAHRVPPRIASCARGAGAIAGIFSAPGWPAARSARSAWAISARSCSGWRCRSRCVISAAIRSSRQQSVAPLGVKLVDMETLLRESDFVCVNCPLSEQTRRLVGAAQFALMKPTAFFINTARGPIVDEHALYEALAQNKIAGAAIDVFEQEPTPPTIRCSSSTISLSLRTTSASPTSASTLLPPVSSALAATWQTGECRRMW